MGLSDFSLENNDGTNWTIASLREPFFDGAGGDLGSPGTLGVNQSFGSSGDTAVSGTLLIPAEQLPIPAEGDTVDLTVLVRNNSSRELAADLWVDLLRPGIAARKVVVNPRLVSLAAGDSLLRLRLLRIPVFGPTGLYELVLHIGAYPDSSGVTDSLRFEKLAPPSAASASDLAGLPRGSDLMQNFPNPFNSSVSIHYALEEDTWVTLAIFDVLGREIRRLVHEFQEAGVRSVHWHGEDQRGAPVGSGVYVYRLSLGPMSFTKKMLLLR